VPVALTLLQSKLFVPPTRPALVPRPRLLDKLNEGLHRKLTLLSAPAGSGKTTLVSGWIAGIDRSTAWLSLDEGDKDPTRFLAYLVTALQTIMPDIGHGVMGVLLSAQPPPTEAILTTLLNEISSIPDSFVLVLDDYHLIDARPVDDALSFLLDHLPPRMHLVIATRENPQLPLARLRARGQLTELRATDLRFTPAEATAFLNEAMDLSLSREDIAALDTRTEGWIAGLQLAALSMQGHQHPARFINSFTGSHRFVLDYLVEEVLQKQPPRVQEFLLRTSILDRLCGPLCEAILLDSSASGQEILEYLERANLFLVPLDNERRWYRYHHLFADLLRQRLGHSLSPGEIKELHVRASEWYEQNGLMLDALRHALKAEAFEQAARLAEDLWQSMDRTFQSAAWLEWVERIPHAVVRARPTLCVLIGKTYAYAGDLDSSEAYLKHAEHALAGSTVQEELKHLPGTIALARATNAQNQGNLVETVRYAELAIRTIPKENTYPLSQAFIALGMTHWATGDLEASLQAMHVWMKDMQRLGNQEFVVASAFAVADMEVILGRLREAKNSLQQAIQQAGALGPEAESVTAHHHLGLALLAHEQGDDPAMTQHLQIAADLGQRTPLVNWSYRWSMAQARLQEAGEAWDAALDRLDEAGRVYVKNPVPITQPIEACKARIYLKQGRLDRAQIWAQERGISVEDEVRYLSEYEHLTLARVRLADGSFDGVNDLLERLLELAEAQHRTGSVIEILLTQALVDQAQGDRLNAHAALERALRLAEPEGYLRAFVEQGEAMRQLLLDFRSANEKQPAHPLHSYVDKILAAFSPPVKVTSESAISNQPPEIIEPLTDRELEVLQLITQGLSNREIGERLFLALDTIKGHNRSIFGKLQVHRRTEAVARAREFGLL
jgi:LuxR family transcriptional regulator, maltose regulon positive regulatory protein